ncbi:dTMP kinase [Pseudomonas veronii]|uniref:dTMP kinase n=1 Tax=Pseudomonas veronii TaxID=76761 RepID=UPI0009A4B1DA|nr:hypothetical protein [Pseudomonas veronii]AQY63677.1 hypothetical protein PverR02_01005 [Pseudomonas veronii]
MAKPNIIAFEGIDGSGKETQCKLLADYLRASGKIVWVADYPRYEMFFGREIGLLLSGQERGRSASTLDPKSMALWYALDRRSDYDRNSEQWLASDYVLLNRSTLSSMVYQSLRSVDPDCMLEWVEQLEFEELGIPRPDLFLIFNVSPKSSASNMQKKGARGYTDSELDVYEGDQDLQVGSWKLYNHLCETRADTERVSCEDLSGKLIEKTTILGSVCEILVKRSLL